jgi:hypothetical protein
MVAPYAADRRSAARSEGTATVIPVTNPLERLNKEVKRRADVVELCGRMGDDGGVKAAYRGGCPSLPEPLSESDTPCTQLPPWFDCVSPRRWTIL